MKYIFEAYAHIDNVFLMLNSTDVHPLHKSTITPADISRDIALHFVPALLPHTSNRFSVRSAIDLVSLSNSLPLRRGS